MICPNCKGTNFEHLTPQDLLELYNVAVDDTMVICDECQWDVTDSIHIQENIAAIEQYLNTIPVFQDKFLEPDYFQQRS
jgi:hypothetical protein